jgi:cation diffusion facilitator family transporter
MEPIMTGSVNSLAHDHVFLGRDHERNERKVWLVIALTASTMVAEIVAGSIFGSMALTADGWHMSTHAGAMLISALAYMYARRNARNPRYTFGTGKLGDLAGFASAIVLALVALVIAWESVGRLADPVAIDFDQAIVVAVLGLAVNLVSAWLLRDDHAHAHAHIGHHGHHGSHSHAGHHGEHAPSGAHGGSKDNNLRAAYLHVLADALTSVLAIVALILGRLYGWSALDPIMGIVGGLVIARWSWGLIRQTSRVLLDAEPGAVDLAGRIRKVMETPDDTVTDLHVWQVGPGHYAAIVSLATASDRTSSSYKEKLRAIPGLSHVTVEVTPLAA